MSSASEKAEIIYVDLDLNIAGAAEEDAAHCGQCGRVRESLGAVIDHVRERAALPGGEQE